MIIDLKTAMITLNDIQEHLTDQYEMLKGTKGMPDEVCDAIDNLMEATKTINDFTYDIEE